MSSAVLACGLKRGLGVEAPEEGVDMTARCGDRERESRVLRVVDVGMLCRISGEVRLLAWIQIWTRCCKAEMWREADRR